MNDTTLKTKILKAVCEAQKQGIMANFEMDFNGGVIVFLEGKHLDSCDYSLERIYAFLLDAITEVEFSESEA